MKGIKLIEEFSKNEDQKRFVLQVLFNIQFFFLSWLLKYINYLLKFFLDSSKLKKNILDLIKTHSKFRTVKTEKIIKIL